MLFALLKKIIIYKLPIISIVNMTTQIDIKSLTGNDKLYPIDFYEISFKPMHHHIWFENDINCKSYLASKSRSENYIILDQEKLIVFIQIG